MKLVKDPETLLPIVQGSDNWLKYRIGKLGATEFAKFCVTKGLVYNQHESGSFESIYKTLYDIYNPKPFKAFKSVTFLVGNDLEPYIRNYINTKNNKMYIPCVIESDFNNRVYASYDGVDFIENKILEIKTTKHFNNFEESLAFYTFQIMHQYYVLRDNVDTLENQEVATLSVIDKVKYTINNIEECIEEYKIYKSYIVSYEKWRKLCSEYLILYDQIEKEFFKELDFDRTDKINLSNYIKDNDSDNWSTNKKRIAILLSTMPKDKSREYLINKFISLNNI